MLSPTVTGRRSRGTHPTLIALHGLNGSSDAHYMRGLAAKAFARGMNVVRLNQRNCGDTEHLSAGLFHSGLTADAAHVIDELTRVDGLPAIGVAGYSLGGNLALKLAGEYGAHAPAALVGVAAVSPIIEIERVRRARSSGRATCSISGTSCGPEAADAAQGRSSSPGRFDLTKLARSRPCASSTRRTPRRTSASASAEDYYHRASAMRVVDRIRVPALIITAEDDPFVPSQPFHDPKVTGNPHIDAAASARTAATAASSARRRGEDDGYWAERSDRRVRVGRSVQPMPEPEWLVRTPAGAESRGRSISSFANSGPFPSSSCLK